MMDFQEKSAWLRKKIEAELTPLIGHDYVLWDVPYYNNIGDLLIWEGERCFLKKIPYKCLQYASVETCCFPPLTADTLILLGGGGNFGDLWRWFQEFRLKVIQRYPHNRIIIFPQSVYYANKTRMYADAEIMANHPDLTIYARDEASYKLLKAHFRNQIGLLPDMAFCMEESNILKGRRQATESTLFLFRKDKELCIGDYPVEILQHADKKDWPAIEEKKVMFWLLYKLIGLVRRLRKYHFRSLARYCSWLTDKYASHLVRPLALREGIEFIGRYKYIYTTRLHVMILAVLLKKECYFLDNSYGKNSCFYTTWLYDLSQCKEMNKRASKCH